MMKVKDREEFQEMEEEKKPLSRSGSSTTISSRRRPANRSPFHPR